MTIGRSVSLLIALFTLIHTLSTVHTSRNQGRKLFGGYRIVPRACRPSIKVHKNIDGPSICMFNYECSQRNGQVVGACMDGFLFGACCLLPPNSDVDKLNYTLNEGLNEDVLTNIHELDHVPDIPILLNPDGTPIESSIPDTSVKTSAQNDINLENVNYTKVATFSPNKNSTYNKDKTQNAEKIQLPLQEDLSAVQQQYPILIGEQQILDDLRLPSLLSHSDSNNDLQEQPDTVAVNPIATILSPDQIFQIADPVDQLPALFSHGFGQNNYTMADTILLNENGTALNETYNPDDLFKPSTVKMEMTKLTSTHGTTDQRNKTPSSSSIGMTSINSHKENQMTSSTSSSSSSVDLKPTFIQSKHKFTNDTSTTVGHSTSHTFQNIPTIEEKVSFHNIDASAAGNDAVPTTPMTPTDPDREDDLIRVPTINNEIKTNNKKNDILDKEEIAINHIISILNGTTPGLDGQATAQGPSSPIHTWISINEPSKPTKSSTHKPTTNNQFDYTFYKPNKGSSLIYKTPSTTEKYSYTFYKPIKPSTHHSYETISTQSNSPSHSTSNTYSSRPSTLVTHGSSSSKSPSSFFTTSPTSSSPTPSISSSPTNNFGYSSRPTTNPPAPTLIVLGPLGTEFTSETTQKTRIPMTTATSIPTKIIKSNTSSTRKPSVSTTITHNISTIISTGNNVNKNNHLIQTSYITVNLKDGTTSKPFINTTNLLPSTEASVTAIKDSNQQNNKNPLIYTTISSWSDNKPSFNLKPSNSNFNWPDQSQTSDGLISISDEFGKPVSTSTTEIQSYEDDASAPNNVILDEGSMSFPPVRNPNLNTSVPLLQQEKPTIVETFNDTGYPDIDLISENEIPTPGFVEDDVLNNKVDEFVEKIVQSLHLNFQDLKDIVNSSNNVTSSTPTSTKRPVTTKKPVRKPSTPKPSTSRPGGSRPASSKPVTPTRKPSPTRKPISPQSASTSRPKPTSTKPKPSGSTTQRPSQTSPNRPTKPIRNDFTTSQTTTNQLLETSSSSIVQTTSTTDVPDFRKQCGIRPLVRNGRIVGGKASQFGKWPWQVLVREATWLGLFTKNKCGGVLITEKYVMTAAHCQPGFLASLVAVFGEFDISGELESKRSISKNVRRVIVYRGYNAVTFENDLALLELESPIQFDEHIVPICMPPDGSDFTGKMATVTGWGRLKYSGGVPSVLQEVKVPVMENSVCQEMFQTAGHSKYILDSFLCAGYANGQKDSCEGDSGGPLVIQGSDGRWLLVGTVSHGIKCAAPYLPGVYMRTTYFKPWLHSITGI